MQDDPFAGYDPDRDFVPYPQLFPDDTRGTLNDLFGVDTFHPDPPDEADRLPAEMSPPTNAIETIAWAARASGMPTKHAVFLILAELAKAEGKNSGPYGTAYTKHKTLAALLDVSLSSIARAVSALEKDRLLSHKNRKYADTKRQAVNEYRVPLPEKLSTDPFPGVQREAGNGSGKAVSGCPEEGRKRAVSGCPEEGRKRAVSGCPEEGRKRYKKPQRENTKEINPGGSVDNFSDSLDPARPANDAEPAGAVQQRPGQPIPTDKMRFSIRTRARAKGIDRLDALDKMLAKADRDGVVKAVCYLERTADTLPGIIFNTLKRHLTTEVPA